MNSLTILSFVVLLAVANAGVIGLHGLLGVAGDGLEGQYIPSGLERLYDDGSYRLEHHLDGHVIAPGVLGLGVVGIAGHGLEGQYIPSGNELHYDDGSYKPGLYH